MKRLVVLINQSSKFEYLVKMVYGLAFMPPLRAAKIFWTVIQDYVNENKDNMVFQEFKEQIEDLLAYYERTWIGALFRQPRSLVCHRNLEQE
jgi:hypothetical protein